MDKISAIDSLAALAQETRLAAFRLLVEAGHDGMPAGEIARALGVPHNTLSTHLAILTRAGLVTAQRDSRRMIHAARLEGLGALMGFLLRDCCGGRPELCAPLLAAAMPDPQRPDPCCPDTRIPA